MTPHSPKGGWKQHAMLTLAAVIPNLGAYQECSAGPDIVDGVRSVPRGPGFDWGVDETRLAAAPRV